MLCCRSAWKFYLYSEAACQQERYLCRELLVILKRLAFQHHDGCERVFLLSQWSFPEQYALIMALCVLRLRWKPQLASRELLRRVPLIPNKTQENHKPSKETDAGELDLWLSVAVETGNKKMPPSRRCPTEHCFFSVQQRTVVSHHEKDLKIKAVQTGKSCLALSRLVFFPENSKHSLKNIFRTSFQIQLGTSWSDRWWRKNFHQEGWNAPDSRVFPPRPPSTEPPLGLLGLGEFGDELPWWLNVVVKCRQCVHVLVSPHNSLASVQPWFQPQLNTSYNPYVTTRALSPSCRRSPPWNSPVSMTWTCRVKHSMRNAWTEQCSKLPRNH